MNSGKKGGNFAKRGVNFIKNLFGPKKKRVIIYHPNGSITHKVYDIFRNHRVWQETIAPKFARMYEKLKLYKLEIPTIDEELFVPREVHVPSFENQQELRSQTFKRFLFREFVSVNKAKLKYCYRVDEEYKKFKNAEFAESLVEIAIYRQGILDLKKTIYCGVCDAHNGRNFVVEKNLMVFEDKFCFDLIDKNSLFIRWSHILLIEYMDLTYQYVKCYESSGSVFDFPFRSFISQHKRRIPFFKRCLNRVAEGGEDFMSYCYFLCSDFKLYGMSTLWDGDVHVTTKMLMVIFNFLRKKNLFPETQVKQLEKILELELLNDLSFADQRDTGDANTTDDETQKTDTPKKPKISIDFVKKQLRSIQKSIGMSTARNSERLLLDVPANNSPANLGVDKYISQLKELHSYVTRLNEQDAVKEFIKQSLPESNQTEAKKVKKTTKRSEARLSATTKKNKVAGSPNDNTPTGFAASSGASSSYHSKKRAKIIRNKKSKVHAKKKTERELLQGEPMSPPEQSSSSSPAVESLSLPNQRQLEASATSPNPERRLLLDEYSGTHQYHSEIFEKRVRPVDIGCLRTFYTSRSGALNPIRDLNYSDFKSVDPKHIIINKFKAYKYENLRFETVASYLDADEKLVKGFNSDLDDMDFKMMVGNPVQKETLIERKVQPVKPGKQDNEKGASQPPTVNVQDKMIDVTDDNLHLKSDFSHDTYTMIENNFFHKD